jgi:hypothetical protein
MKRFALALLLAAFFLPQLPFGQTGTEKKPTKLLFFGKITKYHFDPNSGVIKDI